jgi:hypothetical protein
VMDCQGIEVLETETFKLHCFQTLTGMTCSPPRVTVHTSLASLMVVVVQGQSS